MFSLHLHHSDQQTSPACGISNVLNQCIILRSSWFNWFKVLKKLSWNRLMKLSQLLIRTEPTLTWVLRNLNCLYFYMHYIHFVFICLSRNNTTDCQAVWSTHIWVIVLKSQNLRVHLHNVLKKETFLKSFLYSS